MLQDCTGLDLWNPFNNLQNNALGLITPKSPMDITNDHSQYINKPFKREKRHQTEAKRKTLNRNKLNLDLNPNIVLSSAAPSVVFCFRKKQVIVPSPPRRASSVLKLTTTNSAHDNASRTTKQTNQSERDILTGKVHGK